MVDSAGDWLWSLLQHWLPHHILLRLAAIQRPQSSFPMDSVGWGLRDDRRFSVKTTYQVRCAVLWNIWRQQNDRVFNGITKEWGSVVTRSKWLAESSAAAAITLRNQHVRLAGMGAARTTLSLWSPPADGWIKLNTDVIRSSIEGRASCGGVLRDHTGIWIRGQMLGG
ncbi:hypothetical protein V6N11_081647 [Hibiscus sabdariffa]|uniref:Uncharacterized protein n=1 Tax=Hibiscus sabdariffa TaxID=183260 RepID=A0ABR2N8V2_9ROSI